MLSNIWNQDLLTADTVGTSPVLTDDIGSKANYTSVYVVYGAGTGAGSYVVEVSHDKAYAGTWATVATLAWAAASSVKVGLVAGPWKALRVRNITPVTGGTADVKIQVNG
jgi:hypothetical protein